MKMNKLTHISFALLVVVCCHLFVHAQDCVIPKVENFDEEGFFDTNAFAQAEAEIIGLDREVSSAAAKISPDYVGSLQGGDFAPSEDLKEAIAAAEADEAPSEAVVANVNSFVIPVSYYQTCPYWWYLVPRYNYYTRTVTSLSNGARVYSYCWSYTRYWIARCSWKNCNVKDNVLYPYGFYYRCVPEYRTIRIWALCYEVTVYPKNIIKQRWVRKLVRISVPYGCCCRGYYYKIAPNQCVAPSYTKAEA